MWNLWKKIIGRIADFQSTVLFSLLYFVLVVPLGIVTNLLMDFFKIRKKPSWYTHSDFVSNMQKMKAQ